MDAVESEAALLEAREAPTGCSEICSIILSSCYGVGTGETERLSRLAQGHTLGDGDGGVVFRGHMRLRLMCKRYFRV